MPIRLTAADRCQIGIAVLVCALCLTIAFLYFHRAFPEASLDLRLNRTQSESIAAQFLADRGLQVAGYRHAAIFDYDDTTKLYLERTVGLEKMDQLTRGPVHLWRWSHRWYRPQQKEEFSVDVTPAGAVVDFEHDIPESQPGPSWEQDRARALAEQFLTQVLRRDLNQLEFVEVSSTQQPARRDHTFIWKQKNVFLGDGSLRFSVGVLGDQIGSYHEYVQIPDQWTRDYQRLRSRNDAASEVATAVWIVLTVAMVIVLALRLRARQVPVRMARRFGMVAALLYMATKANEFSLAAFSYNTTDSYLSFVASYIGSSALAALGIGLFISFLVATAEPVYRESFPNRMSLGDYLSWKGLRTRSFLLANIVGITLAFFFFAYQTVFYLVANRLGAWAPSDISFTNDLNTAAPWAGVLFMGFFPAVSEEMQFRAFAVPFLSKRFRSVPLGVIVAAFSWGFLHSGYPNEPFYIRGLEVGLGGILIGVVMLRFGIVATLIWHYSVDALYTAFVLLRAGNVYLVISGGVTAGVMLLPLAVAWIAYLRRGTFEEEAVTHAAPLPEAARVESAPLAPQPEIAAIDYRRLSPRRLRWAAILTVLSLAALLIPAYRFGQGVTIEVSPAEALRTSDRVLAARGVDPREFHRVATLLDNVDGMAVRYMLQRISLRQADPMYRRATQLVAWQVRYFRPEQKEEYRIFIDASTGQFLEYRHILPEEAPGAFLSMDAARAIAEKAMADHGYVLADFDLQDSTGEKRKNRQDYRFVWQAKTGDPRNLDKMHYRTAVEIAGDEVVSLSDSFDLPEEWMRQQEATHVSSEILVGLEGFLAALLLFRCAALFMARFRAAPWPWKSSRWIALLVGAARFLSALNAWRLTENGYSTAVPWSAFWLQEALVFLLPPVLAGLLSWVVVAFALSLYPQGQGLFRRAERSVWRRDAVVATVVVIAASLGIDRLTALASEWAPRTIHPSTAFLPLSQLETWSPAAAYFLTASYALLVPAAVAIAIATFQSGWSQRAWWLWVAAVLFIVTCGPADAQSVREFLANWSLSVLELGLVVAIGCLFFRNNPLAYATAAFCALIVPGVDQLLSQNAAFYRWNGFLLLVLTGAVLLWVLWPGPEEAALMDSVEGSGAPVDAKP